MANAHQEDMNTAEPVLPLAARFRLATAAPARVIGVLADPREDEEDTALLHLAGRNGATLVHVLDDLGRLHRSDGPAVVRISGKRRVSTAWWVDGRELDESSGPVIRTNVGVPAAKEMDEDEAEKVSNYLPRRFHLDTSGRVYAPATVQDVLTEEDLRCTRENADGEDPIVELAVSLHAPHTPEA